MYYVLPNNHHHLIGHLHQNFLIHFPEIKHKYLLYNSILLNKKEI